MPGVVETDRVEGGGSGELGEERFGFRGRWGGCIACGFQASEEIVMRICPESPVTARIESVNTSVVHAATSVDHSRTSQRKVSDRRKPSACTSLARGRASLGGSVSAGLTGLNCHVVVGAFKRCCADFGGPRGEVRRRECGHGDR